MALDGGHGCIADLRTSEGIDTDGRFVWAPGCRPQDFLESGYDSPKHPKTVVCLLSTGLLGMGPEGRQQCVGPAKEVRIGQQQNGLYMLDKLRRAVLQAGRGNGFPVDWSTRRMLARWSQSSVVAEPKAG